MDFYDDAAYDFLAFLERRLGLERAATAKKLGEWLASYEPVRRKEQRSALADTAGARRGVGDGNF